MSMKQKAMRRFALSDRGYRNLRNSVASVVLHDICMMVPVMVLFLLVCDAIGGNAYDLELDPVAYVLMCAVSLVLIFVTYRLQYNLTFFTTYKESAEVRISIAERLRRMPLSFFAKKDPTDLSTRIMGDVTMQESAMTHWFPELIGSMVFTAVVSVFILAFSPVMGAAALWPVPVSFAIVLASKRVQKRYSDIKNAKALEVNEGVQEYLELMRDLRGSDASGRYLDGLEARMDEVERCEIRSEFMTAAFVVSSQLVLKFGIVTTALVGAIGLADGTVDLFVFIAFLILISRFYDPMSISLQNLAAMIASEYNLSRLSEIEEQPIQEGSDAFYPDGYDIVFDRVRFGYGDGRDVLEDVSFTAKQGEVTALVGPSGGGKSTVAKLAARFWDADGGRITVGGVDIRTVDPETLLSYYSIVFQDVVLFNSSVMDNIRIGRKGATDEEVLEAAKAANCDAFVSRLEDGYRTVIGENGAKLSGGERQRISIARAILKDAPIILLDEATASLDTECESQVQAALSRLIAGRTVIVVAHRMRTVEGADRIVVISGGTVSEQGTPGELMESGGMFARMVGLQRETSGWSLRSNRPRGLLPLAVVRPLELRILGRVGERDVPERRHHPVLHGEAPLHSAHASDELRRAREIVDGAHLVAQPGGACVGQRGRSGYHGAHVGRSQGQGVPHGPGRGADPRHPGRRDLQHDRSEPDADSHGHADRALGHDAQVAAVVYDGMAASRIGESFDHSSGHRSGDGGHRPYFRDPGGAAHLRDRRPVGRRGQRLEGGCEGRVRGNRGLDLPPRVGDQRLDQPEEALLHRRVYARLADDDPPVLEPHRAFSNLSRISTALRGMFGDLEFPGSILMRTNAPDPTAEGMSSPDPISVVRSPNPAATAAMSTRE